MLHAMLPSVKLPKMVAIQNQRLAMTHHCMMFGLAVGLIYWKFIIESSQYGLISMTTNLEIEWKENESIEAMEGFLQVNEELSQECNSLLNNWTSVERWGHVWSRVAQCASMCQLDDVLSHTYWPPGSEWDAGTLCFSDFRDFGTNNSYTPLQFLDSWGKRDVILVTGKKDWIVDHEARHRQNLIEVVPQGLAAKVSFEYKYRYDRKPPEVPFLSSQHQIERDGTNSDAITIILDQDGLPVATFQPGEPIELGVTRILNYVGIAKVSDTLITGGEIIMAANCFGSNEDLNKYLESISHGAATSDVEGTLSNPVCTIHFELVAQQYQLDARYTTRSPIPGRKPMEVMSETTGLYFKADPGLAGHAQVLDAGLLVLQITSMMVLLAMPQHITFLIAARFLGPLSTMYRRSIVEPYDVEEQVVSSATALAANIHAFHTLKEADDSDGKGEIKMSAMKAIAKEAFECRKSELDAEEIGSLAHFLFHGMRKKTTDSRPRDVPSLCCCCDFIPQDLGFRKRGNGTGEPGSDLCQGITIDQWNQSRMDGEKVTFEAVAQLFDTDRRRFFLERWYTPRRIRLALVEAKTSMQEEEALVGVKDLLDYSSDMFMPHFNRLLKLSGLSDGKENNDGPPASNEAKAGGSELRGSQDLKEASPTEEPAGGKVVPTLQRKNTSDFFHVKSSAPSSDDLRRELDALAERLACAEDKISQEAKPCSASGRNHDLPAEEREFRALSPDPENPPAASASQSPRWNNGTESVNTDASGMEKRLADVENSVRRLARQDSRSSFVPRERSSGSQGESRKAWAEAILNSFGPDALPEVSQTQTAPRTRTRRRGASADAPAKR